MDRQLKLTMGPVLFNWPPERWRDFYFQLADAGCIDAVTVGEVVCSKRAPFLTPHFADVLDRLSRAAIEISVATVAQVMSRPDRNLVAQFAAIEDVMIEVNDASALALASGKRFATGPFLNVYNEETLALLAEKGAKVFCLPPELSGTTIARLAEAASSHGGEVEVQVYGRIPLALSARCYHARAHGLTKDGCQFVCERDLDGLTLHTLDGKPLLVINGIQTMSYSFANLAHDIGSLANWGVSRFRLSPHSHDMVSVARLFRSLLDRRIEPEEACRRLGEINEGVPFSNGFVHGLAGAQWVPGASG